MTRPGELDAQPLDLGRDQAPGRVAGAPRDEPRLAAQPAHPGRDVRRLAAGHERDRRGDVVVGRGRRLEPHDDVEQQISERDHAHHSILAHSPGGGIAWHRPSPGRQRRACPGPRRWSAPCPPRAFVIAADSGLEHAAALGLGVDVLVGDLDSASAEAVRAAEAAGVRDRAPCRRQGGDRPRARARARARARRAPRHRRQRRRRVTPRPPPRRARAARRPALRAAPHRRPHRRCARVRDPRRRGRRARGRSGRRADADRARRAGARRHHRRPALAAARRDARARARPAASATRSSPAPCASGSAAAACSRSARARSSASISSAATDDAPT